MRKVVSTATVALATVAAALAARGEEIRAISDRYDENVLSIEVRGAQTILKTEKRELPLENVKHIRFDESAPVDAAHTAKVILLNRDEIRGIIGEGNANGFKIKTTSMGEPDVNLDSVAGIFFDVPAESEKKLYPKLLGWLSAKDLAGRPAKDTVHLKAGGKTGGTIESVSSKGVQLEAGPPLGKLTFPREEVEAVVTANTNEGAGVKVAAPKGTIVRVRCRDGSTVSGGVVSYQGGKLELENPLLQAGKKAVPLVIASKDILDLFVLNGAFVYVSDLVPAKVVETFTEGFERDPALYGWKADKEVMSGGRLRLGGRTYEKGLGVHSYSSLTYNLGGAYKQFRAVIGLDDSTKFLGDPGSGSVTFRILVDGKPPKELLEGKRKKKAEAPDEIQIDVSGAKTLELVVDYGEFMQILGRADWADAHLVK